MFRFRRKNIIKVSTFFFPLALNHTNNPNKSHIPEIRVKEEPLRAKIEEQLVGHKITKQTTKK